MIFATAMTIGVIAGLLRSPMSVALIAALIGLDFLVAFALSAGMPSLLSLLFAYLGYNAGLIGFVVTLTVLDRRKEA